MFLFSSGNLSASVISEIACQGEARRYGFSSGDPWAISLKYSECNF